MPSYDVSLSLGSNSGLANLPRTDFKPTLTLGSTAAMAEKQLPGVLLEVKARMLGKTLMKDKRATGLEIFMTFFN